MLFIYVPFRDPVESSDEKIDHANEQKQDQSRRENGLVGHACAVSRQHQRNMGRKGADGSEKRSGKLRGVAGQHKRDQGVSDRPAKTEDCGRQQPLGSSREQNMPHLLNGSEAHRPGSQPEVRVDALEPGMKDQRDGRQNEDTQGQRGCQQSEAGSCLKPVSHPGNQQKDRNEAINDGGNAGHEMDQRDEEAGHCRRR